ncbi:MAG: hypothetical protein H6756_11265 [Candidatus Omnitrophica bacterium]|nr:hypothetical protein [Candidatus Omnitrophota bacterium]
MYDFGQEIFGVSVKSDGPQGQLVYSVTMPISYKNCQLLCERVSLTSYLDWMGQVREYSLRPVLSQISELTRTGKWGLATNSVKLRVFDLLRVDDILEVRLWLSKITGHDNIYHLCFDFSKLLCESNRIRSAEGALTITCVDIIGHGEAKLAKAPQFLQQYFDYMRPKLKGVHSISKLVSQPLKYTGGEILLNYREAPRLIHQYLVQTTMEDSNLVGNIYFANYGKWAKAAAEMYLRNLFPQYFYKEVSRGEFLALEYKSTHTNEAMPFDEIIAKVFLVELRENMMDVQCVFYKKGAANSDRRLAVVRLSIFYGYVHNNDLNICALPDRLINSLRKNDG